MTDRFKECLRFVLKWEGGLSNHPDDPGGLTNKGITQRVYDAWRTSKGLQKRSVAMITDEEVQQIYWERYWLPSHAHDLPPPLDLVVFDTAVNCGVGTALRLLQQALKEMGYYDGILDGVWGLKTQKAIERVKAEGKVDSVVKKLIALRNQHYRRIADRNPKLRVFLKGWFNRTADLLRNSLTRPS